MEDKETCNISETLPTRCSNEGEWLRACEFATFYSSTIALLPTHRSETNQVIARNRRIGVGIIDVTGWIHETSMNHITKMMRRGYEIVRSTNRFANSEAGVPESIRVTCIKPGGTIPKVAGRTSGASFPTFIETCFNVRVAANAPVVPLLIEANIPYEPEVFDPDNTLVFKFPSIQGPAKPADKVSLWEQANLLVLIQREWADNAVSNTLYFKPKWKLIEHIHKIDNVNTINTNVLSYYGYTIGYELDEIRDNNKYKLIFENKENKFVFYWEKWPQKDQTNIQLKIYEYDPNHEEDIIEIVLASIAPVIKSCSLLPHSAKGVYRQMPQEGLTPEEYQELVRQCKPINWKKFSGSDGDASADAYCSGGICTTTN